MGAVVDGSRSTTFKCFGCCVVEQSLGGDGREHVVLAHVHGGAGAVFLGGSWRELAESAGGGYGGVRQQLLARQWRSFGHHLLWLEEIAAGVAQSFGGEVCIPATAMHFNFGCVEAREGEVCAGMIRSNVIRHQVEHFLRFKLANR